MNKITLCGFALLILAFLIYLTGILRPYVPMDQVIQYWNQSSQHYMQVANLHPGWAWVSKLGYGDFLIYIPIVILAGATIVCYLGVIFKFLKTREYILVVIAILEVAVLAAAASGLLQAGGH